MTVKKKITISIIISVVVVAALIFMAIIILSLSGVFTNSNTGYDAKKIAIKQFGMDEVLLLSSISTNSNLIKDTGIDSPVIFVVGLKNGEEHSIIVPIFKRYPPYETEWLFDLSFREIVAKINEVAGNDICHPENYKDFMFLSSPYEVELHRQRMFGNVPLDVDLIIHFHEYLIFQTEHELKLVDHHEYVELHPDWASDWEWNSD